MKKLLYALVPVNLKLFWFGLLASYIWFGLHSVIFLSGKLHSGKQLSVAFSLYYEHPIIFLVWFSPWFSLSFQFFLAWYLVFPAVLNQSLFLMLYVVCCYLLVKEPALCCGVNLVKPVIMHSMASDPCPFLFFSTLFYF